MPGDEIRPPTSQNKAAQLRFLALNAPTPLKNVALFKTQIPDYLCEGRQRQVNSQDVVHKHKGRRGIFRVCVGTYLSFEEVCSDRSRTEAAERTGQS